MREPRVRSALLACLFVVAGCSSAPKRPTAPIAPTFEDVRIYAESEPTVKVPLVVDVMGQPAKGTVFLKGARITPTGEGTEVSLEEFEPRELTGNRLVFQPGQYQLEFFESTDGTWDVEARHARPFVVEVPAIQESVKPLRVTLRRWPAVVVTLRGASEDSDDIRWVSFMQLKGDAEATPELLARRGGGKTIRNDGEPKIYPLTIRGRYAVGIAETRRGPVVRVQEVVIDDFEVARVEFVEDE